MESVTYVISLDALDFNILSNTYKPRHTVTPVWNVNRNDLCAFTINTPQTSPKPQCVNDESPEVLHRKESTMCHICNTYVPKQYLQEHKRSFKHKTYLEISNTALKRIEEEMRDPNINEEIDVNESIHFCSHCVSVVNVKDRINHERSLNHKNSVYLDNCLLNFLTLYSSNIEEDDTGDEANELITTEESLNEDFEIKSTDYFDLNSYLRTLKDTYNMPTNIKVINEDLLEINFEGSKVRVTANDFLGLKENSSTSSSLECVICREDVRAENRVTHLMGPKHIYRVSKPMHDTHCKREIYPFWFHCVLCNVTFSFLTHHTNDPVHNKRLKEALKSLNDETGSSGWPWRICWL